jgi:hypothetical protein
VDDDPDRVDAAEPTVLPADSPSKAVDLVKKGDELFKQEMSSRRRTSRCRARS